MNDKKTPRTIAELTDIEMEAVSGGGLYGEDVFVLEDIEEGFSAKRKFINGGWGDNTLTGGNGNDF